ncbi:MAG: AsmA family protein [Deltaproteobacteria bacterium]|nr:AsmA family protein [Deltaproteobacteria bacterium]
MKAVKWVSIGIIALIVIVIGALLVIPLFVDVQKYKPYIEQQVSQATGCPFSIGGELKLSLFPSAGVAFSDLHLGNPPGFTEKDLLAIESFDVKVKFMPLLSGEVHVERFIMDGLKAALEKDRDGRGNWEAVGKPSAAAPPAETKAEKPESGGGPLAGLPVRSIAVGELKVSNAGLLWIDQAAGERREIRDLMLELRDVSLDRPIRIMLSAKLDGNPLQLDGTAGPLDAALGGGSVPLDMAVKAFGEVALTVKGTVSHVLRQPAFDLAVEVAPFSPRKLAGALGREFPVATADPTALTKVSLKTTVKGNPASLSLTDGIMELDQSRIVFSARAKDFARPDVTLRMNIDRIDVDRYLPPAAASEEPTGDKSPSPMPTASKKPAGDKTASSTPPAPKESVAGDKPASSTPPAREQKKIDYGPLRKLVVDAELRAGEIKVMGARARDVVMRIQGRDGVFTVDPCALKAYQGSIDARADLDVRADRPKTGVNIDMADVMARPLLNDLMQKDFLEGTTWAHIALTMEGDDPDTIKRTLNGEGTLHFTDGAIVGIDLPGMVRNVKAAFGAEKPAEKPKTDFSELAAPFTIKSGVVTTSGTRLASPLLRVAAAGKADLVNETLNLRVEPTVVATLKGQQDTKERSGLTIPVLITGTFSSPRFAPDLKGLLETKIRDTLKAPEQITDILTGGDAGKEPLPAADPEKVIKGVLKGLFGK